MAAERKNLSGAPTDAPSADAPADGAGSAATGVHVVAEGQSIRGTNRGHLHQGEVVQRADFEPPHPDDGPEKPRRHPKGWFDELLSRGTIVLKGQQTPLPPGAVIGDA